MPKEVATQTEKPEVCTTYAKPDVQQMLVDSQNITIQLLCEKIAWLQAVPFISSLRPEAEVYIPAPLAPQLAHNINLSELIPAEESSGVAADSDTFVKPLHDVCAPRNCEDAEAAAFSAEPETLIIELEQLANDADKVVEVLPTVDSLSQLAFDELLSDLQGIKAALANREQIVEDLKTELINGLNPDLLTSKVVDQILNKISACEPDAVWCLVPSRSTCLQICEDNMLLGVWDTLFSLESGLAFVFLRSSLSSNF